MVTNHEANATSRRRVAHLCHFHFLSRIQVIFRFSWARSAAAPAGVSARSALT